MVILILPFFIISPKKYSVLMFYSNFAIFFYKHTFFNTFLVEKIMRRKFDENLVKVSLKLSVGIWFIWKFHWNFHWNFPLQVKVSMKLSTKQNSFMKISLKKWKFHIIFIYEIVIETFSCEGKFQWNFHMPTESFSETFTKLSSHVHLIIFSIKKMFEKMGKMFV